jgi:DNA-binding Lrp family transcriptional regulator
LVDAYILAKVETGADKEVLSEIKNSPEVKKVCLTYGPYDLAIEATFESIEDLDGFIFDKLRKTPDIKETLTVICSKTVLC